MPRQRLTIGTFGDISTRQMPSGRYEARTRYRDWDGHARLVQGTGATAKAAERALKAKLVDRDLFQPADTSEVRLPADYVKHHLELGYAVTSHRAQGITTDSSHVVVTHGMTLENLYVAMTRGREGTRPT